MSIPSKPSLRPLGPVPSRRQILWQSTEVYGFIHFGLNTFSDREWGYGDDSPGIFNPSHLDADQWARVIKEAGMGGLILVCKHHDGFCLWPTKTTDYNIRHSPWRGGSGDLVAEVSAACQRHGLKFGAYVSPWDRNHAAYGSSEYVEVFHRQVEEIITGYGPLFEVWFDAACGADGYFGGAREERRVNPHTYYQWDRLLEMIRKHQPDAAIFNVRDIRWIGHENGKTPLTCWQTWDSCGIEEPSGLMGSGVGARSGDWMPAEVDFPLRKGWFYHPKDEIRSAELLFDSYLQSVGRGCTMSLGLAPNPEGLICAEDVAVLRDWKSLLDETFTTDLLQNASASPRPSYDWKSPDISGRDAKVWILPDRNAEISFRWNGAVNGHLLLIEECIELGQRIDRFEVDLLVHGEWLPVGGGTSVGYRRLLVIHGLPAEGLRIRFLEAAAPPVIRRIGFFTLPSKIVHSGRLMILRSADDNIRIQCTNPGLVVRYETDGSEPTEKSPVFTGPFPFAGSGTVRAAAFLSNQPDNPICRASATFGISRKDWKIVDVSLNSPYENGGAADVTKILDDDPATYWHTYHSDKTLSAPPHHVIIDMRVPRQIAAFTFMPRILSDDGIPEAIPDRFAFSVSDDGKSWTKVAEGEFSNIKANPGMQTVLLANPVQARFFRFDALRVIDDGDYVIVAGLGVLAG